jgi:anti-sigma factor RsiW
VIPGERRTLDCHEAFPDELVESYVRGRLDEAAMQSFEEHYFGCPDCLERLETFQALPTAWRHWWRPGSGSGSGREGR